MGDQNRFLILADFIHRNFKPCKVADVAGGGGMLSYYLSKFGFDSTVIDPRKSGLPKELRRTPVKYMHTYFHADMAKDFDLVIGLHPDGATKEICLASQFKPVVVVPCCNYWTGIETGDVYDKCLSILKRYRITYWQSQLKIAGKNRAIITVKGK